MQLYTSSNGDLCAIYAFSEGSDESAHLWLWLKAVTEPNSAIHTAIAEWTRPESTENDASVRFFDTGI